MSDILALTPLAGSCRGGSCACPVFLPPRLATQSRPCRTFCPARQRRAPTRGAPTYVSRLSVMDKVNPLPLSHKLPHILGEMIAGELMAVEVRREPVLEAGDTRHHPRHVESVVVEVGGEIEVRPRRQVLRQELQELPVHQPSLSVLLLRPGIGAVDVDRRQRPF